MNESRREQVWRRADGRCEYCQMPHAYDVLTFVVEHIIARKHGGSDDLENLALACYPCNAYKGPNISGLDPRTGQLAALFHPRRDSWKDHFEWNGPTLIGKTSAARATIDVLRINLRMRVLFRQMLIDEGVFPRQRPPR